MHILLRMELEWDAVKRRANYAKHGLDFRDAAKVFQGITLTARMSSGLRGKTVYFWAVGGYDRRGRTYGAAVKKTRIISMRKANHREGRLMKKKYFWMRKVPLEYEG